MPSGSLAGPLHRLVKAACEQSSRLFCVAFLIGRSWEEHRAAIPQTHHRDRVIFIEIFFVEED